MEEVKKRAKRKKEVGKWEYSIPSDIVLERTVLENLILDEEDLVLQERRSLNRDLRRASFVDDECNEDI